METKNKKFSLVILFFLFLALAAIIWSYLKIGFHLGFFVVLAVWILIFLLYFLTKVFKTTVYLSFVFIIWLVFSFLISFNVLPGLKTPNQNTSTPTTINGIKLADCTSTLSNKPQMLTGWKSTMYSAPLESSSPNPDKANNIRTFSLSGIKNKTEKNSFYVRIEKTDGSSIAGYDTTIEVCNSDNKASYYYATNSRGDSDKASENSVARINYLHGGSYLFETGTYRIDAYIKDLNGKWHLVSRVENIKITE